MKIIFQILYILYSGPLMKVTVLPVKGLIIRHFFSDFLNFGPFILWASQKSINQPINQNMGENKVFLVLLFPRSF